RGQSGERADEGDDDAFHQNLQKDRQPGRANRFADADLADAFVDAREHDVHDADAADDQTDRGDDAAAQARVANLRVDALNLVFLRAEAEVFDAPMGHQQHVARLLQRGLKPIQTRHLHVNVRQARIGDIICSGGGAEPDPHRVHRHINRVVLAPERPAAAAAAPAAPARRTGLFLLRFRFGKFALFAFLFALVTSEHADDGEGLPVDENLLTNRDDVLAGLLRRAEQFVPNAGADDANTVGFFLV